MWWVTIELCVYVACVCVFYVCYVVIIFLICHLGIRDGLVLVLCVYVVKYHLSCFDSFRSWEQSL